MKKTLLLLMFIATLSCCDDDDDPVNSVDQLPPPTQIGANTFGCLLDGEAFLPSGGGNPLDCVYQFVSGGYYFTLQANKRDNGNNLIAIALVTENLEIVEGITYNLYENANANTSGAYFFNTFLNYTTQTYTGKLFITKLDPINQIVSGTFWYDIEDYNGVVHQIREGRFDMHYTQ